MSAFAFLFAGQNIPFLVAIGCCVALALVQIVAGFGESDADADVDADAHANAEIDADADIDADVDADSDVAADADGHGDAEGESADGGLLGFLGVGSVPLMLILIAFLGSFGAAGLLANVLVAGVLGSYPNWAFVAVLLASALAALPLTRAITRTLGGFAARTTTAITSEQLVGRVGVVVSQSVSRTYGRVAVRDRHGSLHTVFAITQAEALPERSEVALVAYDEQQRRFTVRALRRSTERQTIR
jgi:membrane protein implicated in regulation of membrane protease activity